MRFFKVLPTGSVNITFAETTKDIDNSNNVKEIRHYIYSGNDSLDKNIDGGILALEKYFGEEIKIINLEEYLGTNALKPEQQRQMSANSNFSKKVQDIFKNPTTANKCIYIQYNVDLNKFWGKLLVKITPFLMMILPSSLSEKIFIVRQATLKKLGSLLH